jgi:hypothetical protein
MLFLSQIEVRCLDVTKGSSGSLRAIIGRFPMRMTQELAQPLKLGLGHSAQQAPELRDSTIGRTAVPGFIASLRIRWRASLTGLVNP